MTMCKIKDEKLRQQFFKVIEIMDKALKREVIEDPKPVIKQETMEDYFKRKGWK